MHACAACPLADTAQEFLSLADSSVKHRIFIHYTGWSNDRWDSWVDARCRCGVQGACVRCRVVGHCMRDACDAAVWST